MATLYKPWYSVYNSRGTVNFEMKFNKLLLGILPLIYRIYSLDSITNLRTRLYKYILCVVQNINALADEFISYRRTCLKRLEINGTTIVLEQYLRDYCLNTSIIVVNVQDVNQSSYLFNSDNTNGRSGIEEILYNSDETLKPMNYYYNESEMFSANDFIVFIPSSLAGLVDDIGNIVDANKFLGTKYTIQYLP